MQVLTSASALFVISLAAAAPALAQQTAAPVQSVRGYIVGGAGATFGGQTTPTLSVEVGDHVTPDIQVYVAVGYQDDLMSDEAREQLVQVGRDLSAFTGTSWNFTGRDRGRSFIVGGKYLFPTATAIRPYVGAGIGVVNLKRTIIEQSRGNMTAAFLSEFGAGDGVLDITQTDTTKPLGEVSAGVGVVIGRAYLDFGYRFRKGFHNVGGSFDFSQIGAAAGVKF